MWLILRTIVNDVPRLKYVSAFVQIHTCVLMFKIYDDDDDDDDDTDVNNEVSFYSERNDWYSGVMVDGSGTKARGLSQDTVSCSRFRLISMPQPQYRVQINDKYNTKLQFEN